MGSVSPGKGEITQLGKGEKRDEGEKTYESKKKEGRKPSPHFVTKKGDSKRRRGQWWSLAR